MMCVVICCLCLEFLEEAVGKVDDGGLVDVRLDVLDKGKVSRIVGDVVIPVGGGGELDDKGVSDSVLCVQVCWSVLSELL